MDWPEAILMIVLIIAAFGVIVYAIKHEPDGDDAPEDGWLAQHLTRRIVVHTTDDLSLEGTLRLQSTDGVVLVAVRLLEDNVELGGDVWVPRQKVAFVQEQRAGT